MSRHLRQARRSITLDFHRVLEKPGGCSDWVKKTLKGWNEFYSGLFCFFGSAADCGGAQVFNH
jgi:hypothetical protein